MMVALKTASGNSRNALVKYMLTTIINNDDRTPAIGVFAPASALTTVRDKLPVTGNAEDKPAPILASPNAISS